MSNLPDFLSSKEPSDLLNNLEQHAFEAELGMYEDYIATLEAFFETEADKHLESIRQLRKSGSAFLLGVSGEEDADRFELDRIEEFQTVMRRSFLVAIYSLLEQQLRSECYSRKKDGVTLALSDIWAPSEIERAKTYLSKVLQQRFPADTPEWQEIQDIRRLRNCIVHNHGTVQANSKEVNDLVRYVSRNKSLSLHGGEIFIHKGYCEEAFRTVKVFLCLLLFGNRGLTGP